MVYAVSEEGILILKNVANELEFSREDLLERIDRLTDLTADYDMLLGPHKDSLEEALGQIKVSLNTAGEAVTVVVDAINEVADAYQDIVDDNIIASAAEKSGSATLGGLFSNVFNSGKSGNGNAGAAGNGSDKISQIKDVGLFDLKNGKKFVPLLETNQTQQDMVLSDGVERTIFDHPFDCNGRAIHRQGSAYPGICNTCGLCASGSIINKAGGDTEEENMVVYAMDRNICLPDGRSGEDCWIELLGAAGISASSTTGTSLSSLADRVEEGKGVIIGVSGCVYMPEAFGEYKRSNPKGHALVLESVIRNKKTGEILSYIVSDSNGRDPYDTCREVPAKILEAAFGIMGNRAVCTDEIIW